MKAFEYITADSFNSATRYLAGKKGTLVKAGGIDVVDRLKERIDQPLQVLNIRNIRPAKQPPAIKWTDDGVRIGALTTLAEIGSDAKLRERLPALATAAELAATPQIRNVATIGGNLCQKPRCWYFRSQDFHCLKKGGLTCYAVAGDNRYHGIFSTGSCHIVHPSNAALPLTAYGATIHAVRWEDGKRSERAIPIDSFYRVPSDPQDDEHTLSAGELIEEVFVPATAFGPKAVYLECREKHSFDWPLVSCSVNRNGGTRVVLGAVAPIPWRLRSVEELIGSKTLDDTLIAKARSGAPEGAVPMTHNAYKLKLVGAIVERALRHVAGA